MLYMLALFVVLAISSCSRLLFFFVFFFDCVECVSFLFILLSLFFLPSQRCVSFALCVCVSHFFLLFFFFKVCVRACLFVFCFLSFTGMDLCKSVRVM